MDNLLGVKNNDVLLLLLLLYSKSSPGAYCFGLGGPWPWL